MTSNCRFVPQVYWALGTAIEKYGEDVVVKVLSRHVASEFKRKKAPIYISRELYE